MKISEQLCTFDWVLLLEYLKVFFSWPVAAAGIVFVFLRQFKPNIALLIDRIQAAAFAGASISAPIIEAQKQAAEQGIPQENRLEEAAGAVGAAPSHNHQEPNRSLPPDVEAALPDVDRMITYVLENPGPTIAEYVRLLQAYNCEKAVTTIFGTQIELLNFLKESGQPKSVQELAPFHHKHQQHGGSPTYSLDQYIHYLVAMSLIESVKALPTSYRLSEFGLKFLDYIKVQYPGRWENIAL